jgi:hypothetical protein
MSTSNITLEVSSNKPGCEFFVMLDGEIKWQGPTDSTQQNIVIEFEDVDDVDHLLVLGMRGKTKRHTRLDGNGEIIDDLLISVDNISVDGINIDQMVHDISRYQHDFNGTGTMLEHRFFGKMGCNGEVSMKFRTPIYLWLLENL